MPRYIDADALLNEPFAISLSDVGHSNEWNEGVRQGIKDTLQAVRLKIENAPTVNEWHEWSEKPERSGSFVVLISNSWSRALNKDVAFYDAIFEEWTIILEGDETPRYWMRLSESPEWNPEWDEDLLVGVEGENE